MNFYEFIFVQKVGSDEPKKYLLLSISEEQALYRICKEYDINPEEYNITVIEYDPEGIFEL